MSLVEGILFLVWLIVALGASFFYGRYALDIFEVKLALSWPQIWHQRWLNFAGAFTGWVVVGLLWQKFGACVVRGCADKPPDFGAWDVISGLVAFVGVTGYLPMAVVGLAYGVAGSGVALFDVVRDWIIKRLKPGGG